jgi:hypothetical protein
MKLFKVTFKAEFLGERTIYIAVNELYKLEERLHQEFGYSLDILSIVSLGEVLVERQA